LYIGDFIRSIQEKKNLEDGIPVSCFTATAKQKVIEDIRDYFRENFHLTLNCSLQKHQEQIFISGFLKRRRRRKISGTERFD
jgi:superfamily II DNA helicase RecQ